MQDPQAGRAWKEVEDREELEDHGNLLRRRPVTNDPDFDRSGETELLAEVRDLGLAGGWGELLELLEDESRMQVAEEENAPKYLYWKARANRNLFETGEWTYGENGKLKRSSRSWEHLEQARADYQELVDTYPNSYLADDALGWVGGCLYRQGEYTRAARAYADQLRRFPAGDDTRRFGANSLYWAVRGALRFWVETPRPERETMVGLLSEPDVFFHLGRSQGYFLPRFWARMNRGELDRLFGSLWSSERMEQFLLRCAGRFQTVYSVPWIEVAAHDLAQRRAFKPKLSVERRREHLYRPFLDFLFYTGEFETCYRLLEDFDPFLADSDRRSLDTYHYLSALKHLGPSQAIQVAIRLERDGGVVAIAYDFAQIEELLSLAENTSVPRKHQDLLRYIAALRLIAEERFDEGRDQLVRLMMESPSGLYRDRALWRLGELAYFVRCDELPVYATGTEPRVSAPYDEADRAPMFADLAEHLFGRDFLDRNARELPRIYRRFRDTEGLAWARRESRMGTLLFRVQVASRIARIVEDLRSLPGFDEVPARTKSLLEGIVRVCMQADATPKARFQFEEAILREVLGQLFPEVNPFDPDEYENVLQPSLTLLWRFANAGRYADEADALRTYQTFQRAQYLFHNESLYRDVEIPQEAWNHDAYQYVYYLQEREHPPLYRGVPYRQARRLFEQIQDAPLVGETAAVLAHRCESLHTTLRKAERWNWSGIPRLLARHLLQPTSMVQFSFSSDPRKLPIDPSNNTVRGESFRSVLRELDYRFWATDIDETAWVLERLGFRTPFGDKLFHDLEGLALRLQKFVEENPSSSHVRRANLLRADAYASLGYEDRADALRAQLGEESSESVDNEGPIGPIDRYAAEGGTLAVVGLNLLLTGDCWAALEIGEALVDDEDPRVREAAGYLRGLALLRTDCFDAAAVEFVNLVEKLPDGDRTPWYLDLLMRCLRSGGTLAASEIDRLERLFDTESPFNNSFFLAVALREAMLRSGEGPRATEIWSAVVEGNFPTRNPDLFCHVKSDDEALGFTTAELQGPVVGRFGYYFFGDRLWGPISLGTR